MGIAAYDELKKPENVVVKEDSLDNSLYERFKSRIDKNKLEALASENHTTLDTSLDNSVLSDNYASK